MIEPLYEFAKTVKASGYRGLVVVAAEERRIPSVAATLAELGKGVAVETGGLLGRSTSILADEGWRIVRREEVQTILGAEFDYAIYDGTGYLDANSLAAVAETVRGGGLLVLLVPYPFGDCGKVRWGRRFCRYLLESAKKARQHLILEVSGKAYHTISLRIYPRRAHVRREFVNIPGLPKWAARLVATRDQGTAVAEILRVLDEEKHTSILILGDRGRGKSASIGIALGVAIARRRLGVVPVTGPSLLSVQQIFTHLARTLRTASVRFKAWGGKLYEGIKGAWFKVYYEAPGEPTAQAVIVIDEAAAVGIARVRRLVSRARKVIAATTVHGYEGSGRALAYRLEKEIPNPVRIELREPIRYPEGDPLEEWLYETLMLRAEPGELRIEKPDVSVRVLSGDELVANIDVLKQAYTILTLAHYRNTPNDLQQMLERDDVVIAFLEVGGNIVSVAEVFLEDTVLRDVLTRSYGEELAGYRYARIVRIATHPQLQRKGFGSKLLSNVERFAVQKGVGLIGASFSNTEALNFWIKNDYALIYVSPRFNKVTGEKNMVVVKPLKKDAAEKLANIVADFRAKFIILLSSVYRDMPAEAIVEAITSCPSWSRARATFSIKPTKYMIYRVRRVIEKNDYPELALEAAELLALNLLASCHPLSLSSEEKLVLTMVVLQGKPSWDAANVMKKSVSDIDNILRSVFAKLYRAMGELSIDSPSQA